MKKFFKKNKVLFAFLLGIFTITTLIPIMSSFGEFVCQCLEGMKTFPIKFTTKKNVEITKLQKQLEKETEEDYGGCSCIGFEVPEPEEVYVDYCDKNKHKIGF